VQSIFTLAPPLSTAPLSLLCSQPSNVPSKAKAAAKAAAKATPPAQSQNTQISTKNCWQQIVERLPQRAADEWYTLRDLSPFLGVKPNSLSKHARDLWPQHTGHWRLSFEEASRLIRRVCLAGKKVKP
jgi:hypothetical protein